MLLKLEVGVVMVVVHENSKMRFTGISMGAMPRKLGVVQHSKVTACRQTITTARKTLVVSSGYVARVALPSGARK